MTKTFEMNNKAYRTDASTLETLRSIIPAARAANDFTAVTAVMALGLKYGKINEE